MCDTLGRAELGTVDVDVADLRFAERFALRAGVFGFRQAGDAMPLEAAMQSAAAQVGDGVFQAAHDVIERQQGAAAELDDDGLFGEREHGAFGSFGTHGGIGGNIAFAPFQDGFGIDTVLGCQGAGRRFRRFELGSNTRRCSGAAVKNPCHSASSC